MSSDYPTPLQHIYRVPATLQRKTSTSPTHNQLISNGYAAGSSYSNWNPTEQQQTSNSYPTRGRRPAIPSTLMQRRSNDRSVWFQLVTYCPPTFWKIKHTRATLFQHNSNLASSVSTTKFRRNCRYLGFIVAISVPTIIQQDSNVSLQELFHHCSKVFPREKKRWESMQNWNIPTKFLRVSNLSPTKRRFKFLLELYWIPTKMRWKSVWLQLFLLGLRWR